MRLKTRTRILRSGAMLEALRQLRLIKASPDSPWRRTPDPGHERGMDFYGPFQFLWALSNALYRYRRKFGRYPDLVTPATFNEKVTWFKFFGELKCPEAGDKLATASFIPEALRGSLSCPVVVWQSHQPALPPNEALPAGVYYLKASFGSDMFKRVVFPLMDEERKALEAQAQRWLSSRYGLDHGEWWYHASEARIFLERSVTGDQDSISWNFYVLNGHIPMIGMYIKHADGKASSTWLDNCFRPLPWQSILPPVLDFKITERHHEMLTMAQTIGRSFHSVRVDFLEGDDGRNYLCELTFSPGDGLSARAPEVEALLSEPWKVLR